jgi:uncharacterized membrane protein YdfJ with MMPL/SSD domain
MPDTTTVEVQKEETGKTVFGLKGLNHPTPVWANWIFRIYFFATLAAIIVIADLKSIDADFKFTLALYLKASDVFVWGIAKGFGIDKTQYE